MKKIGFLILCFVVVLSLNVCLPCMANAVAVANVVSGQDIDSFVEDIGNLFVGNKPQAVAEEVYLGGYPIGISIDGDGVTVIGLNEFFAENGKLCCPAAQSGFQINDVIVELDGKAIYNSARLVEVANDCNGNNVTIKAMRKGKLLELTIAPIKDLTTGQYRLGLWTRDASSGIGTLTYVRKNLQFGSLGHPISTQDGKPVQCKKGGVFACEISGVVKGQKGCAGELKGNFCFAEKLGVLYANNKFGAFGTFSNLPQFCDETIAVANVADVKCGKAQIWCTLEGNQRKCYDIEIVKAVPQNKSDDRGLVVHVTDKDLLAQTGGIVQGMSGSPIVQNGKLVGAVTHVFVNDPTRGYGIYAKWMLDN